MKAFLVLVLAAGLTACDPAPLSPCPSEDYDGPTACVWDAQHQGNGMGRSFVWDGQTIHYTTNA